MATMKLYELVNHYHIGTELTCAEAMFMACNEYYQLNLSVFEELLGWFKDFMDKEKE